MENGESSAGWMMRSRRAALGARDESSVAGEEASRSSTTAEVTWEGSTDPRRLLRAAERDAPRLTHGYVSRLPLDGCVHEMGPNPRHRAA